tara:strand:+ start:569 stop:2440 length:1872 start_codon:yes stop_codon:yes gene_type:complete
MIKETITIEAQVGKAVKGVEDLTKQIEDLQKQQKEQGDASIKQAKQQESATNKATKATKALGKGVKGIGLAMKAAGIGIIMKLFEKLSEALMKNQEVADAVETAFNAVSIIFKQITDVLIDVFKSTSESTGGFDALQKVLGGALMLSINLVVGAIQVMSLGVKKAQLAWENSFLGGKDPETIKRLEGDIEDLETKLIETGENIKQAGTDIATNFVEAVTEVGTLATNVAQATADTIKNINLDTVLEDSKKLTALKKNFELLALEQQRLVEQYDLAAETQRQIRDDESKSIEDRIAANEKLNQVLNDQSVAEKAAIQAQLDALELRAKIEGDTNEIVNERFSLNTEMIAIDAKVAGFRSEQLTNENSLLKEQTEMVQQLGESKNEIAAETKRIAAEEIENLVLRLKALQEINDEENRLELERLKNVADNAKAGTQAKVDADIAYAEKSAEVAKDKAKTDKEIAQAEKDARDEKTRLIGEGLQNLSTILGEETAAGKAAAIAATTISTYQSAQKSYDSLASIPVIGVPLGIAAAGAAIVSGIAQVKKITAVKTPAGKGAAATGATGQPAAPPQPPRFNLVGSSDANQLAGVIGEQDKKPIKAFVVSKDVTTKQSLDRDIVKTASL